MNEIKDLMPTEEYIRLREKAIEKLRESRDIDEKQCEVGTVKVSVEERDALLYQLTGDYEYLQIPLELYLTDVFWRTLKAEANKRIRHIKVQDITD